jgi:hypothetical protein
MQREIQLHSTASAVLCKPCCKAVKQTANALPLQSVACVDAVAVVMEPVGH